MTKEDEEVRGKGGEEKRSEKLKWRRIKKRE